MKPARLLIGVFALIAFTLVTHADEAKFSLKSADAEPPPEVKKEIAALLEAKSVQVLDAKGALYCEVWFRKAVPAKATEAQIKNGITFQEIEQTNIFGAIRFAQPIKDYRNQDVKPGVYTLRLAKQPQDGDHMGTAPHPEFCLLVSAESDTNSALMEPKALHDLSAKTMNGNHPGVMLLFPIAKVEAQPQIADQGMDHWVIKKQLGVSANGKPASIGIGLTIMGKSSAS